jgi:aspartate/methionine/tyrosine aminotransferase
MTHMDFTTALEAARAAGRVLFDLTETDPARCGLGWTDAELAAILERREEGAPARQQAEAREAIAGYLAGHGAAVAPQRIFLTRSLGGALRELVRALAEDGGEVLVPVPGRLGSELGDAAGLRTYELEFEGRWRIDRRSLRRSTSKHTRAVLVGNPAEPMGAALSAEELAFVEELCAGRGAVLVADESALDTTLEPPRTVAAAGVCAALHLSGLGGVCGLEDARADWLAVAGPPAEADRLAARLATLEAVQAPAPDARLVPPLLGRREAFLTRLRARLARNRSALASASLREAPWTLAWGGGRWAVLQVNPAQEEDDLCLDLLAEGVAVLPGHLSGLPRTGYLALSLLPAPESFDAALERLEDQLRRPGAFSARP